jgi:hypothetical protein
MSWTGFIFDTFDTHLALLKVKDPMNQLKVLWGLILGLIKFYVVRVILVSEPMIDLTVRFGDWQHRKITVCNSLEMSANRGSDDLIK